MDFGTGIIGLSFLLFCFIVFVILSRSNRKREKQLLRRLTGLAKQHNFTISKHDTWNHSAIGIDKTANILFVICYTNSGDIAHTINLSEVERCRVMNANKAISNKEERFKMIEKLELVFANRDKNKPETIVELYNVNNDNSGLSGELQLAEKWCKIANDNCKASSIKK